MQYIKKETVTDVFNSILDDDDDELKDTLNEVNLGNTFSEEEISKISIISADYMEEVDRIKEEVKDETPVSRKWKLFGEKLKDIESGGVSLESGGVS